MLEVLVQVVLRRDCYWTSDVQVVVQPMRLVSKKSMLVIAWQIRNEQGYQRPWSRLLTWVLWVHSTENRTRRSGVQGSP